MKTKPDTLAAQLGAILAKARCDRHGESECIQVTCPDCERRALARLAEVLSAALEKCAADFGLNAHRYEAGLRIIASAAEREVAPFDMMAELKRQVEVCDRCDGVGWYEGGKVLQTRCEKCDGSGFVKPAAASGEQ